MERATLYNRGKFNLSEASSAISTLYDGIIGAIQNEHIIKNMSVDEYYEYLAIIKENVRILDDIRTMYVNYANDIVEYASKERIRE